MHLSLQMSSAAAAAAAGAPTPGAPRAVTGSHSSATDDAASNCHTSGKTSGNTGSGAAAVVPTAAASSAPAFHESARLGFSAATTSAYEKGRPEYPRAHVERVLQLMRVWEQPVDAATGLFPAKTLLVSACPLSIGGCLQRVSLDSIGGLGAHVTKRV